METESSYKKYYKIIALFMSYLCFRAIDPKEYEFSHHLDKG